MSWLTKSRLFLREFLLLAGFTCWAISSAFAQTASSMTVGDSESFPVHAQYGKAFLADVPSTAAFRVISKTARWSLIQFSSPTVPVWVSADFLQRDAGLVTVTANRLNMRSAPSMDGSVLASVDRGYQSAVLEEQNGFVKILAPTNLIVAINVETKNQPVQSSGDSNVAARPASQWRTQLPPGELVGTDSDALTDISGATAGVTDEANTRAVEVVSETNVVDNQSSNELVTEPEAPKQLEPELSASLPPRAISETEQEHILAPGDTISLRVFGERDLSLQNVRIPQSGQVSFPLVGPIQVAGKRIEQVEQQLRDVLSQGYVNNPRLSVTIDSYRPIFVLGAAETIGSFPFSEGLTVAKAIAVAGGAKFSARKDGVSVLRDGEIVEEGLSINSQLRVLSGDIISIDEEEGVGEEAASFVYLHGEVRSPGEYEFRRGLTVEKAVVLAGGFTLRASRRRISVSRIVDGEERPKKLKKVALHMPVLPGDIIDVGASWF